MRPCGIFDERYSQDISIIRTWQHWVALIAGLILVYTCPFMGSYYLIGLINSISITIILVLGLQLVSGFCGQISFGQPAFMAVGAYASVILTTQLNLSFWLALPVSGLIAGISGTIAGAPSMRIKGFYLAIATIAIHFLAIWFIVHMDITGGVRGLNANPPCIGSFSLDTDERIFYLIVTTMLVMTFGARNLVRSRIGRAFVAIRDNDLAAQAMGLNVYKYKLVAFFISCFYAGIAGVLWAHSILIVHPEQFTLLHALYYVGMIVIGGMGSIPGVFFGVLFVRLLDEAVLYSSPFLAKWFPWLGLAPAASLGICAFGIVLIVFLIYEPRGLAHRWEIFKQSYRAYPFHH